MRRLILSINVTLDGFMSGPNGDLDWHFTHWNEKMGEFAFEQLSQMDTILVGRTTYQSMAGYWPSAETNPEATTMDREFAAMMNKLPKVVFSNTLKTAGWNNSTIVSENIKDEVNKLKSLNGKDMIMWGGVGIVSSFIKAGLIDEYRIFVAPVLLGKGKPLFKDINASLKLLSTKTFTNGVVLLQYANIKHTGKENSNGKE